MKDTLPFVTKAPSPDFAAKAWPQIGGRPGCFLGQIAIPKQSDLGALSGACFYCFGGYEESSYKGTPVKKPFYAVVELRNSGMGAETHLLFQDNDVFFARKTEHKRLAELPAVDKQAHFEDPVWKERFEVKTDAFGVLHDALKVGDICPDLEEKVIADYEQAGKPKARKKWLKERLLPEYRWLKARPRWVEDEGEWPAFLGKQMVFIGQVAVPENEVAAEYALGGKMIYLFAGWSGNRTEFKILQQEVGTQTAEQHYRAEEMMALYLESPKDPKVMCHCVEEGDQYVHEFLLRQPGLKSEALKLLGKKGANKSIRDEAQKRLKS